MSMDSFDNVVKKLVEMTMPFKNQPHIVATMLSEVPAAIRGEVMTRLNYAGNIRCEGCGN